MNKRDSQWMNKYVNKRVLKKVIEINQWINGFTILVEVFINQRIAKNVQINEWMRKCAIMKWI